MGTTNSGAGMLTQAAAVMAGLLAVLYFFNDNSIPLDSLEGKKVLITGASTGIGEQLAYQFARHGSHVTVTARRKMALEEVSRNCSRMSPAHRAHHVIVGDMEDLDKTKLIVEKAVSDMGGLDLLVLNHILPHPIEPFKGENDDLKLLQRLVDINFRSYVHLTTHALPHLTQSRGRIVVINSAMGKISHPFLASYAATKHALDGFFSSLRSQFEYTGQTVGITSCFLGYIGTDSAIKGIENSRQSRLKNWVKPASPEDTARAIVQAAAAEQDELYYPWHDVRPMVLLYSAWPGVVDGVLRFLALRD